MDERIAWFHCFSGITGNSALGALIDAGADMHYITESVEALGIDSFVIEVAPSTRGGISCQSVNVKVNEDEKRVRSQGDQTLVTHENQTLVTHENQVLTIENSDLPSRIKQRSLAIIHALTEVGVQEVDDTALIEIVGITAALEDLRIDHLYASPIANGTGLIESESATLPNPTPTVINLLEGIPTYARTINDELTTSTGAALMAALAETFGEMPLMTIENNGFGAGANENASLPNVCQVIIGSQDEREQDEGQPVIVLETTVDDVEKDVITDMLDRLLEAGARDAWATSVVKKDQSGYVITSLCDLSNVDSLREVLGTESGAAGVRGAQWEQWPQAHKFSNISVDGTTVRVKVGQHRAKVELDDATSAAKEIGRFVRNIVQDAEQKFLHHDDVDE